MAPYLKNNIYKMDVVNYLFDESELLEYPYLSDDLSNVDISTSEQSKIISLDKHEYRVTKTESLDIYLLEKILIIGESKNMNSEEVFEKYDTYPGEYMIDNSYYFVDSSGIISNDDSLYYDIHKNDSLDEIVKLSNYVDLNFFIDTSYNDGISQIVEYTTFTGNTKWTDDQTQNKALLAYIINRYYYEIRFREDIFSDLLVSEDADYIKSFYDDQMPPESYKDLKETAFIKLLESGKYAHYRTLEDALAND